MLTQGAWAEVAAATEAVAEAALTSEAAGVAVTEVAVAISAAEVAWAAADMRIAAVRRHSAAGISIRVVRPAASKDIRRAAEEGTSGVGVITAVTTVTAVIAERSSSVIRTTAIIMATTTDTATIAAGCIAAQCGREVPIGGVAIATARTKTRLSDG